MKDLRKRNLKSKKTQIQTPKRNGNVLLVNLEHRDLQMEDQIREISEQFQEIIGQDLEGQEEVKDPLLLRKRSQQKQISKNKLEKLLRNYKGSLLKEKEQNIVEIKERRIVSNLTQN